ncbi:MAG: flagellar filament capping protein FliD [Bdellovibrionaceae bacterium]|nr:flagellar filament capping protein FliD [Pseudobdellovibrionaceae bacterium]
MAGIRITGMASGLPPDIVEQIMTAERIPVKQMEAKKAKEEEVLKLVGDLETKLGEINKNLSELVGTRGFMDAKLISGDPAIVDGSVDPEVAETGEYHVEVIQLAQKPGAISNGWPDRDYTQIGAGYIRFDTPEGRRDVYISSKNSTLDGVAAQINSANIGVRAFVIEDRRDREYPFRLLVTGLATGEDNLVKFPTVYMIDGDEDFYFDESRPSQNAKLKLDGFLLETESNTIENLIPGVTLDLKQAAPGRLVKLNIKENLEVITGKIKAFVEAYNGALGFIQGQAKLQKTQNGQERLGPLGGDSMIRGIENTLRRIIQSPQHAVQGEIKRLNQLGIEFNRNGTLNFNQEKFNKVLSANPKAVVAFLRGDNFNYGFVPTVRREINNMTNASFGGLGIRKRGIQDRIKQINQRIENKERQLERKEDQLRKKFADLEQKMTKINAQGAQVAAIAATGVKQS